MRSHMEKAGYRKTEQAPNVGLSKPARPAMMTDYIYCLARKTKIDLSVCTVQSFRHPHDCAGCPLGPKILFKKGDQS